MRSAKNYLLLGLAALALGLAGLAWRQHRELIALRADALTNGERADWQKRIWAAQKRAQSLETELAAAKADKVPAAGANAAQAGRGLPARADVGRVMAGFASMMDRPEAARLLAFQQKAQVDARFAALFKKLGLPADKLAQFKALLADRLATPIDVLAAGSQQGINPMQDPQAFRQLVQNAEAEIDRRIQALLDPASYTQYQNYVQTEPQRAVVNQLQQSLSYTDTPLSSTQADQLVQILAATSSPSRAGSPGLPGAAMGVSGGIATMAIRTSDGNGKSAVYVGAAPGPGGSSVVTDEAITQASGVLSGPQLQALQQIQQQQQAAAQMRQQMFQNAAASGLPPPPPPPAGG